VKEEKLQMRVVRKKLMIYLRKLQLRSRFEIERWIICSNSMHEIY
jgi:hypothetical protein